MSGARTSINNLSNNSDDEFPQGSMFLLPRGDNSTSEILPFSGPASAQNDPNESFELREMVSVANTYFDRGMIDDAEQLLHEAIAAGYTLPDATELLKRIRSIRGATTLVSPSTDAGGNPSAQRDRQIAEFTRPLPGAETQSTTVRRSIEEAERDLDAGRLQSAHDATLYALALAPQFLPIYVRLSELRLAFGDYDGADALIQSVRVVLATIGDDGNWLTQSMRVSLDPDNTEALIQLARSLIAQQGTVQLDPYVPAAIERTLVEQPEVALDLSREYRRLRPSADDAQRLHLRSVVAAGDSEQIRTQLQQDVTPASPADLLFLRSGVAYADGRDAWFQWLERTVDQILNGDQAPKELQRAIEAAGNLLPASQNALATAIVRLACNDAHGAVAVLAPWDGVPRRETSNAQEMLVAACAKAHALRRTSAIECIEALANAVGQAVVIDVRPFAETCKLFARPISAEALMHELVEVVRETGEHELAILHLQALRDRLPEHLEIRTGLADLQVAAGRTSEGVRELRYIAERYEQAGNIERMVEAMRHISAAVPNNAEMKAKLIEGYIQRGVPEDAMCELSLLGDLHLKRGRNAEAAKAYTRGAEIASTTGSFPQAMDLFDRAVAADPGNVGVRHAAVAHFIMTGAVDKATEQLREIVRIAIVALDPDEAVAALHQIIGLAPAEASAYHKLGEVLTSLGEYAQAERVYRRLAVFTPDDPVLAAKQSALSALAEGP